MSVYLSHHTGQQWEDLNGIPLAGGSLSTFQAQTNTPLATYSDNLGAVANPTTITLDARGEPSVSSVPVQLWLAGGQPYKFVLKDAGGNTIWTFDNESGINDPSASQLTISEWIASGLVTAWVSNTQFSAPGDQTAVFTRNRRVKLFSGVTIQYATITAASFAAGSPGTTTVTVAIDGGANLNNPVSSASYGLFDPTNPSIDAGEILPGRSIYKTDVTGPVLFGPIGSNLVTFTGTPAVSADVSAFNTATGQITWTGAYTDSLRSGEAVQWTGGAAPGNLALATTYIYFRTDATHGFFYLPPAGWIYEATQFVPPAAGAAGAGTGGNDGTGGGLVWAGPAGTGSAAVGAGSTCTPGWVVPLGVTRIWADVIGAGGGGGGSRGSTGDGVNGSAGTQSTFSGFTGGGGTAGNGGSATVGGSTAAGLSAASGGTLNLSGQPGQNGVMNTLGGSGAARGGPSKWGTTGNAGFDATFGSGGTGGQSTAANQGGGAGGGSGAEAIGFLVVTPSVFMPAVCGQGGAGGAGGTGAGSGGGRTGGNGIITLNW